MTSYKGSLTFCALMQIILIVNGLKFFMNNETGGDSCEIQCWHSELPFNVRSVRKMTIYHVSPEYAQKMELASISLKKKGVIIASNKSNEVTGEGTISKRTVNLTLQVINCASGEFRCELQVINARDEIDVFSRIILLKNASSTEETTPHGEITPEETTPHGEITPEETTPHGEIAPEETTPHGEIAPEETTPHEEITPEETTPHEEITPEETTPHNEITPEETTPHEEITPETTPKVHSEETENPSPDPGPNESGEAESTAAEPESTVEAENPEETGHTSTGERSGRMSYKGLQSYY